MCWPETLELPDESSSIICTIKGHVEMMGNVTISKDRAELKSRNLIR